MRSRTSPPDSRQLRQQRHTSQQRGTDMPRPVTEPRELRTPSEAQRAEWVRWLTQVLLHAGYGMRRPDGRYVFWWANLSAAIYDETHMDVPRQTLQNYRMKGTQPSAEIATALAHALGLHPLSISYKAGLYSLHDLAIILGSSQLRTPQELYEELETIRLELPEESGMRQRMETRLLREINAVQRLRDALSEDEWGGLQAERIKLEIADQSGAVYTAPAPPAHLPLPSDLLPQRAGVVTLPPSPSVRAGPTRQRVPHPGDDADGDGEE